MELGSDTLDPSRESLGDISYISSKKSSLPPISVLLDLSKFRVQKAGANENKIATHPNSIGDSEIPKLCNHP